MNWTEDDTYNALVGREVSGTIFSHTYTVTNQTVYFYEYVLDGATKQYSFINPPKQVCGRHNSDIKALASPDGYVRFL